MIRILGLSLLINFIAHTAYSQHYYNDLVMSGEIVKKRATYQTNKVKAVKMTSFDNNNQPIEGFGGSQEIAPNFATITTETFTSLSGKDEITHYFNEKGQLTQSIDTADGNKVVVQYTYDANNLITGITNMSFSPGGYSSREQHLWFYNKAGKPERMLKIKNSTDTTIVNFKLDDKENVAEERSVRAGTEQPVVYYYYDDKGRLSDVVRYNNRAKRLLPDYIFEYDETGRVSMMLVTTAGGADYQKWIYRYDEKGLKLKDECFAKNKMMVGKIEYKYE
jgi:antitoxin component YwqK of YwqJK toxin-antitoxin module